MSDDKPTVEELLRDAKWLLMKARAKVFDADGQQRISPEWEILAAVTKLLDARILATPPDTTPEEQVPLFREAVL